VSFFDRNPIRRLATRVTGDIDTLNDVHGGRDLGVLDLFALIGIVIAMVHLVPGPRRGVHGVAAHHRDARIPLARARSFREIRTRLARKTRS
jgi:hypothetical protein